MFGQQLLLLIKDGHSLMGEVLFGQRAVCGLPFTLALKPFKRQQPRSALKRCVQTPLQSTMELAC
jgi:hypothetical protein